VLEELITDNILEANVLRTILDNCYDAIEVIDENYRVIYANKGTERMNEKEYSRLIGSHVDDLYRVDPWNPMATPIVIREKKQITIRQSSPSGREVITTSTPLYDAEGKLLLIVHESRDIKQLERLLKELESIDQQRHITNEANNNQCDFRANSKVMQDIICRADQLAKVEANALLLGESGTGKGVLAKYIHSRSVRKNGAFVAINCAAIPDELLESELFGYTGGAFTGAVKTGKKGIIELADGGTLFLDEISELSPRLQAKLLLYIQDRTFMHVGGTETVHSDARIIAATNSNLEDLMREGKFRPDLFYRLDVVSLTLPPLRKRESDIKDLTFFFLDKFNDKYSTLREITPETLELLYNYFWPGNVRELENTIERLVITSTNNIIKPENLPDKIKQPPMFECNKSFTTNLPFDLIMEEMERNIITKSYALLKSSHKVADALNISQTKAFRLIKKYCDAEGE
jgi:transcriptional regulator with PAS, ATPase and Fis domain